MPTPEQVRHIARLAGLYNLRVPVHPVCREHNSPGEFLATLFYDRPDLVLGQGPRGGGKAQPLDSLVQTPLGPKRMGEIAVGDQVCTPDGGVTTVVAVHPQGTKPVWRVSFRDGDSVECCWDHLWEVSSKQRAWRQPKIVTTEYLFNNYLTPSRRDCNFSIRLPSPVAFHPRRPRPLIPPYTLGVLVGDGCLKYTRVSFTSADAGIVEAVRGELPASLRVNPLCHEYAYSIRTLVAGGTPNAYLDELRRVGLGGKGSHEKHLPPDYLYGAIEDRWELIRGLMDTDGYVDSRGHASYCTTSPQLARDFKFLAESLGGLCVAKTKETGFRLAYNLYLKFDDPSRLFRLSRKRDRGFPRTKYPAKRIITDVSPVGERECQCITVADPAGLYLTDHCVVTHNSLLAGFDGYLKGGCHPEFESKILGGSQAQSEQIYRAMDIFRKARPEADFIREMHRTEAFFHSGASVQMLTASSKSVRGPHVPQLNLDEVDEIDDQIREDAAGMVMRKGGLDASIIMTSTWHKVAGPMAGLIERANAGEFPSLTFCAFDVLERCPDERSGPHLENCPACPLVQWCHAGKDEHPSGLPKAKRSSGHYGIDALIQKVKFTSRRVFESDYLCKRPRAAGQWFKDFDEDRHVTGAAEYDRGLPFHVAIDPGVHTGAVWFQVRRQYDGSARVNVFGDYYAENVTGDEAGGAEAQGRHIVNRTRELTGLHTSSGTVSMDQAHRQRTNIGPSVVGEYTRAGCVGNGRVIRSWPAIGPGRPKVDTLALLEALLLSADGTIGLTIHPRCKHLPDALVSYTRKQKDGQWLDEPADPQHPHEESIDSLTGGLITEFPEGRMPEPRFSRAKASMVI